MHITTENKKEYFISEVLELDHGAFADYRNRMRNLPDTVRGEHDPDVEQLFLLVVGDGYEDGIIIDFSGRAYEGIPAFAADARSQLEEHIRQLADYCVREGADNTQNGKWPVTYEELYYHFDHTAISSRNGIGTLLREELQQREEINELIMAEDCIEMTYHMEYCPNCQSGGIKGAMSLFSLMGCNLYDVHLQCDYDSEAEIAYECESGEFISAKIAALNQNTLTEQGKQDWSDILNAEVKDVRHGSTGIMVSLADCSLNRLHDFCAMLHGETSQEYYDRCVADPNRNYAPPRVKPSSLRDGNVCNLIATYEELYHVPQTARITHYFGDYGGHFFGDGVTLKDIRPVYEKALDAIEMDDAQFRSTEEFLYRGEIIGRMRDCLLAKTLEIGEEVLFVATVAYNGVGDFALRGGFIKAVDPEEKTCTVRGDFFDMEDVPLRYILGRYDESVEGLHYGFRHVDVLYGEYPALADQYLREVEKYGNSHYETESEDAPIQMM